MELIKVMCVKALPAAPAVVMMWCGVLSHSLQSPTSSLKSLQTVILNVINLHANVHFQIFNQI